MNSLHKRAILAVGKGKLLYLYTAFLMLRFMVISKNLESEFENPLQIYYLLFIIQSFYYFIFFLSFNQTLGAVHFHNQVLLRFSNRRAWWRSITISTFFAALLTTAIPFLLLVLFNAVFGLPYTHFELKLYATGFLTQLLGLTSLGIIFNCIRLSLNSFVSLVSVTCGLCIIYFSSLLSPDFDFLHFRWIYIYFNPEHFTFKISVLLLCGALALVLLYKGGAWIVKNKDILWGGSQDE